MDDGGNGLGISTPHACLAVAKRASAVSRDRCLPDLEDRKQKIHLALCTYPCTSACWVVIAVIPLRSLE
jgi:hypothetical protein